jgi:XRE family transcriptional regulator, regulator of sulfur utilization
MINGRDMVVAILAASVTLSISAFARSEATVMSSSVFDWNTIPVTQTKTGFVRRFFQAPTATLDELECHVTTLNPGESPHSPHKHVDEELIIIKEGTVEAMLNGETRRVGPGSVIFQASNQMHGLRSVGDGPAIYHVIKWNSPGILKNKPTRERVSVSDKL